MPRLVLLDDNGRELAASEVSQANVDWLRAFVARNGSTLRTVAAGVRTIRNAHHHLQGLIETFELALQPPAPPRVSRPAGTSPRRATARSRR